MSICKDGVMTIQEENWIKIREVVFGKKQYRKVNDPVWVIKHGNVSYNVIQFIGKHPLLDMVLTFLCLSIILYLLDLINYVFNQK